MRMERIDTDKVYDKVEKDLAKEIQTTQACAQLLATTHDKIVEQIRKDRSARYYLEKVSLIQFYALFNWRRIVKTNHWRMCWTIKLRR